MTILTLVLGMLLSYVSIRSYRAILRYVHNYEDTCIIATIKDKHVLIVSDEEYQQIVRWAKAFKQADKLQKENRQYREALRSVRSAVAIKVK